MGNYSCIYGRSNNERSSCFDSIKRREKRKNDIDDIFGLYISENGITYDYTFETDEYTFETDDYTFETDVYIEIGTSM
jgi:hypothetical protein